MKIVNLIQGTPEWHAHRHAHHNASEAAAMLGLDPKTSRTELLHMKHTGSVKEFSDWVQKNVLDKGHAVEAKARPIIEEMIGDDLYPVTGVEDDGNKSASFDGLTMGEEIIYEHKQWNNELAAMVQIGQVPDTHMPQLQQQLMVSGAEKVIFVVSDGTAEKLVFTEVYPDASWFLRIDLGWIQFEKDLADYKPREVEVKAVAETMIGLPALTIQSSGSISIKSNLDLFGEKLALFVKDLNLKPETDQDFANAEAAVKVLQNAQDALEAAEANALAQASDVDEMRRTVAAYSKTARETRLMLEKVIKAEKETRRLAIVNDGRQRFSEHIAAIEAEIKPIRMPTIAPDFPGAIKGLKTISSIQGKVDDCLANAKIEADGIARDIRGKLVWHSEYAKDHMFLFVDLQQIIGKSEDDFKLLCKSRIDEHKAAEDKRLEAERERIRAEESAKIEAAAAESEVTPPAPPAVAVVLAQEVGRVYPPEVIDTGATIKLGEIAEILGFSLKAEFLRSIGFEPTERDKSAMLYRESDFPKICDALIAHIQMAGSAYVAGLKKAA